MNHLVLAIIKAKTIPCRVFASRSRIEELVRITGIVTQTFYFVFHSVAMHQVHNHTNASLVCRVNQLFQLIGRPESAARCKERTYVITKATIIRMLSNRHNLNAVVAIGNYAWQHILAKFVISTYFLGILCHTNVALVDKERSTFRTEVYLFPFISLFRTPYLCAKNLCIFVLHHTLCPCRHAFTLSPIPMNRQFIQVKMLQHLRRKFQFPITSAFKQIQGVLSNR